ncbi:NADH-cytochrome b5 reductase, partial [Rhizopus azygosporus]
MSQYYNPPTLFRAPVSVRKMVKILQDPAIFASIAAITVVGSVAKGYIGPTRVLDQHTTKEFKLQAITPINHNTSIYRFSLPRQDDVLGLPTGQHIVLTANINGKEVSRSYTPITSDEEKGYFELLIKNYPNGALTQHISKMKVGDKIGVRGPK